MKLRPGLLPTVLLAFCAATAGAAGKAHEHGAVRLDVAVEGRMLSIGLESPLDNLVGFERAPRTPAERARADAAVARLRAAAGLFKFDASAGCRLVNATVTAPVLGVGAASASAADDGHGDLDADFSFECQDIVRARQVEVGLFEAFPGMRRIDVQVATPQGQSKQTLQRGASTVKLVR